MCPSLIASFALCPTLADLSVVRDCVAAFSAFRSIVSMFFSAGQQYVELDPNVCEVMQLSPLGGDVAQLVERRTLSLIHI